MCNPLYNLLILVVRSLAADAWHLRTSKQSPFSVSFANLIVELTRYKCVFCNEQKDPTPPDSSCFTNEDAMTSQMHLMAEMRQQAKRKLKRISAKERTRILDSVRIYSFDELLRQHNRVIAASRGECDPDTDSTAEMDDVQVCFPHRPVSFRHWILVEVKSPISLLRNPKPRMREAQRAVPLKQMKMRMRMRKMRKMMI